MATAALLVMDVQNGVVDRLGERSEQFLATLAEIVATARAAEIRVVYVRVAFRQGAPEVSSRNQIFSAVTASGALGEREAATQIHPAVAPQSGDVVVTKRRVSAFSGSDLAVVLRSLNVDSLVLTGIATSGVVLSTLREAADLDFRLTVIRDACADSDPEVHRVLMDKVFPRQSAVTSAQEWIGQPRGGAADPI
jgi:nicotinamidase-related amidase